MKEPHVIVQINGKTLDPAAPPLLPMWITPDDWLLFLEWDPHADGETQTRLAREDFVAALYAVTNRQRAERGQQPLEFDPFEFHRRA